MTDKPEVTPKAKTIPQKQRFIQTARELQTDESSDALEKSVTRLNLKKRES